MNDSDRNEIHQIRAMHKELEDQLFFIGQQLARLNARLEKMGGTAGNVSTASPPPIPKIETPPVPDWLKMIDSEAEAKRALGIQQSGLPLTKDTPITAPKESTEQPMMVKSSEHTLYKPVSKPASEAAPATPSGSDAQQAKGGSLEMQFGTYWLVRIGVVFFLAALAFAANYAYHNIVAHFGPGTKLAILYLICGGLTGVGLWLEGAHENIRNYARVLAAGGLAGLYYTTYAATYGERLRVIESPVIGGLLLLMWSAGVIWLAERKKSEIIGLFAIGLAYFTTAINPIGNFTLAANLILSFTSTFFLLRNRWSTFSMVSLVGTYLSFALGRVEMALSFSSEQSAWITETFFLAAYWTTHTIAVFLSKAPSFSSGKRVTFVSVNNAAAVGLIWLALQEFHTNFGAPFLLVAGVVLLVVAVAAKRYAPAIEVLRSTYLLQGLVLFTAGLIAEFSGASLALMLAAESVILIVRGDFSQSRQICRAVAHVCGFLATYFTVNDMRAMNSPDMVLGISIAAAMIFNAWWLGHGKTDEDHWFQRTFLSCLALAVGFSTINLNTTRIWFGPTLAVCSVVLTYSEYWLEIIPLAVCAQFYLLLAQLSALGETGTYAPWWNPVIVLGSTLAASRWCQLHRLLKDTLGIALQAIYALAVVGLFHSWLEPQFSIKGWVVCASLLSLALLFYGTVLRSWFIAAAGQIFLAIAVIDSINGAANIGWVEALVPLFTLTATAWSVEGWMREDRTAGTISTVLEIWSGFYRLIALFLTIHWVNTYVAFKNQAWVVLLIGFGVFIWNRLRADGWRFVSAILFTLIGFWTLWFRYNQSAAVYWPNWFGIFLLVAQQPINQIFFNASDEDEDEKINQAAWGSLTATLAILTLWLYTSRWVDVMVGHVYLTIGWGLLALPVFGLGFALKDRLYRWFGLGILICALARVGFIDIWHFTEIYRIVTCLVLAGVMLGLGFIYNWYGDSMRKWL